MRKHFRTFIFPTTAALVVLLGAWLLPDRPRGQMEGHFHPHGCLAVASNGKLLATLSTMDDSSPRIRIWDAYSGHIVHEVKLASEPECVLFSPDNSKFAVLNDQRMLRIWCVLTGQELLSIQVLEPQQGTEPQVDWHFFSPPGFFFSEDGVLLEFREEKGAYKVLEVESGAMRASGRLPVWWHGGPPIPEGTPGETESIARALEGHFILPWVRGIAGLRNAIPPASIGTANGTNVFRIANGKIEAWDLVRRSHRLKEIPGTTCAGPLSSSGDGRWLTCAATFDTAETSWFWERIEHWLFGDRFFLAGQSYCLFDTVQSRCRIRIHDANGVLLSRDGSTLVVSYADRIEVWDLPPGPPWRYVLPVALAVFLGALLLQRRRAARHREP